MTRAASPRLPIYMDYNATTPVDPAAFEAMRPFFCETFGNPSSNSHCFGRAAKDAVDRAATQLASLIGCSGGEVVWTSGTTESNNLAIKGVAQVYRERGRHIISQTTEHKSVLVPLKNLAAAGYDVNWLGVDRGGRIDLDELRGSIRSDTILVSIMYANNETGVVQPIREIGAICRERGVLLHTDATQAVGKIPVGVDADHIDLLAMTGHKLYGPKGVGALYVRCENPCVKLVPLIEGGGHQNGLRSGTLNAAGIVGLGAACEMAQRIMSREAVRLGTLRDKLESGIRDALGDCVHVNGDVAHRLPHVSNLGVADVDGQALMEAMDDVAVSSGSACTSANPEPSFVLRAMGVPHELALASIRLSLGRGTTEAEVDYAIEKVATVVRNLRRARQPAIAK